MSVLDHYHTSFDALEVMRRYAVEGLEPDPAYVTNYLGIKVDPKFHPPILNDMVGTVEPVPIPANWHADIAEWAGVLRSVDLAAPSGKFTAVELGCAWGCWLNNAGAAARQRGLDLDLCGVEGDQGYIDFARESLTVNGFSADEIHLTRGIAAAKRGTALFPRRGDAAHFGLEPTFNASRRQVKAAQSDGTHDVLETVTLADITPGDRIDLLHIDIQGGELDFVRSCLDQLKERVAFMFIGSHSRQIDGALFEMLLGAGWRLEIERPTLLNLSSGDPVTAIDGAQSWRNLELLPL